MTLHVISNGYLTRQNHVIFEIPNGINKFTIYRDGKKLVENDPKVGFAPFVQPTLYDSDHHTNLFKKDSTFKLMYIDTNVFNYRRYDYYVVAESVAEDGTVTNTITTSVCSVETQ